MGAGRALSRFLGLVRWGGSFPGFGPSFGLPGGFGFWEMPYLCPALLWAGEVSGFLPFGK